MNVRTLIRSCLAFALLSLVSSEVTGRHEIHSTKQLDDARIAFYSKDNSFFRSNPLSNVVTSVSANNVADIMAHAMGVPALNEDFVASNFVSENLFSRPSSALMINIAGVGQETLRASGVPLFAEISRPHKLRDVSDHLDSLATATSIATGQSATEHGIVGRSWENERGELVEAFSAPRARSCPVVATFSDVLSQTFSGRSLVISASSDAQLAQSQAPHYSTILAHPEWNIHTVAQGEQTGSLSSVKGLRSSTALQMSSEQVLASLQQLSGFQSAENTHNAKLVASISGKDMALSVADAVSVGLASELAFCSQLDNALRTEPSLAALIHDDAPDFFAVSFRAVEILSLKYGKNSEQVAVALSLIQQAVKNLIESLSSLYQNEMIVSVAATSTSELVSGSEALNLLEVRSTVAKKGKHSASHRVHLAALASAKNGTSTAVTATGIRRYQITLWTAIVLVTIVFVALYTIGCMENKRDNLLYGKMNSVVMKKSH